MGSTWGLTLLWGNLVVLGFRGSCTCLGSSHVLFCSCYKSSHVLRFVLFYLYSICDHALWVPSTNSSVICYLYNHMSACMSVWCDCLSHVLWLCCVVRHFWYVGWWPTLGRLELGRLFCFCWAGVWAVPYCTNWGDTAICMIWLMFCRWYHVCASRNARSLEQGFSGELLLITSCHVCGHHHGPCRGDNSLATW